MINAACMKCGVVVAPGWRFCPRCGAGLEESTTAEPGRGVRVSGAEVVSEAEKANIAGSALYDQEKYDEAIVEFLKAVDLEPENPLYHANLAVAYHDANMLEQALERYQRAAVLDPRDTTCRLNMGHLYTSMEDKEKARECYRQVVALAPESEDAAEARDALEELDRL